MDFKKCSEVYGYKSIAEVEEEEIAEKIAQRDRDWIKAMIALGDSNEKIAAVSNYIQQIMTQNTEVEEEEIEAKIKDTKLEMVDAMFTNTKLTDEEIAIISGVPLDEIQKRRAQR